MDRSLTSGEVEELLINRIRRAHKLLLEAESKDDAGAYIYGEDRTIHRTTWLDVETFHGTVVAVWYRCMMLPFNQTEVEGPRATEMEFATDRLSADIHGILTTRENFYASSKYKRVFGTGLDDPKSGLPLVWRD